MVSLGVFLLLLAEIVPPTRYGLLFSAHLSPKRLINIATSLSVPLIGRYLLFTLLLVTLSVALTILVLNVNFRSSTTCRMSRCTRVLFLSILPRLLGLRRLKHSQRRRQSSTTWTTANSSDNSQLNLCESDGSTLKDDRSTLSKRRSKVKFANDSTACAAAATAAAATVGVIDQENCSPNGMAGGLSDLVFARAAAGRNGIDPHIDRRRQEEDRPELRKGQALDKAMLHLGYLTGRLQTMDEHHEVG